MANYMAEVTNLEKRLLMTGLKDFLFASDYASLLILSVVVRVSANSILIHVLEQERYLPVHRVAKRTLVMAFRRAAYRSVELGQRHRAGDDHHAAGHVGGTGYLTSAAGEVARDVTHGAVRSNNLNVNDRFKDRRFSFGQGVKHGFSAGRDESNFLGVHRMALTVIDDNANVVDRVTGNIACIQSVTDTFFYSRDEVVRNCAAFDFVNEFETGSAFTRFNAKIDFTELAGAACLLLVAAWPSAP